MNYGPQPNINVILTDLDSYKTTNGILCVPEDCSRLLKPTHKSLTVLTQNIRSLACNSDNFYTLLMRTNTAWDVIVLTECWLPSSRHIPVIQGYDYVPTRNNLTQNEGVVVYFRDHLCLTIEEPSFSDGNCLIIKMNSSTVIIAIYRPPGYKDPVTFLSSLNSVLTKVHTYQHIILIGDINIDLIHNTNDQRSWDYLNLLAEFNIHPGHRIPTRLRTCLDHVMVKSDKQVRCFVMPSTVTDHSSVALELDLANDVSSRCMTRRCVDWAGLDLAMKNLDLVPLYSMVNANEAAQYLTNLLTEAVKNSTKVVKTSRRKIIAKPWITPGLLRCMRNRDNLHKKSKKYPYDIVIESTYKRYRNFCNSLLKKVRREYERDLIHKSNNSSRKLWDAIKHITQYHKSNFTASNSLLGDSPQDSVDNVNKYFANIGRTIATGIFCGANNGCPASSASVPINSLVLFPTDEAEIEVLVMNLKDSCAVGHDQISGRLLKLHREMLVPAITFICNLSIKTGVFPEIYKKSIIAPIHKGGDRNSVENYRPISLLPVISKILERVINKRLTDFLERNNLLSPSQFGFRTGRSTDDAVLELTEFVARSLDDGDKVMGIFLDLAKAFDTVSVSALLDRLESIGVRGLSHQLFVSYLSNRFQAVKIDKWTSFELPVTYGVPQGSVLGPTLFLIYVNQLCEKKLRNGKLIAFADDTVLLFRASDWCEAFRCAQEGLNQVSDWLSNNSLALNGIKTKYMTFSIDSRGQPTGLKLILHANTCLNQLHCCCPDLVLTDTVKYLGVMLDSNLNFRHHLELVTGRIRKLLFVFKTLRHLTDHKILKLVYLSLCQSLLGYCISSWGGAHKTHLLRLERAQRAVLKVAAFLPFLFPTTELYNFWKVLTVRQLFILSVVLRKHSLLMFDPHLTSHRRRKGAVCTTLLFSTRFAQRFFCFLGNFLYNRLNTTLNIYPLTKHTCKKKLTLWLLDLNYENTEKLITVIK